MEFFNPDRFQIAHLRRLLACLSSIYLVILGCDQPEMRTVSLLDQISPAEPAGQWRVAGDFDRHYFDRTRAEKMFTNLVREGDILVQTAETSHIWLDCHIHNDELPFIAIRYSHRWQTDGYVTAHFSDRPIGIEQKSLRGRNSCTLMIRNTASDARGIRISHSLDPETPIPLESITVLAVRKSCTVAERKRAKAFLKWRTMDRSPPFKTAIALKKFPVSSGGSTKYGTAMISGDTLDFDISRTVQGSRLKFSVITVEGTPQIAVESRLRGTWRKVSRWRIDSSSHGEWEHLELDTPIEDNWDTVRFILLEKTKHEMLILGDPAIIPPAEIGSNAYNLVLIDLDTMRADRLGCYGYNERPTSTRLDSRPGGHRILSL